MAGRPVPGQFNNGLVARSMPKMGDELVVVPLFWKVKEKRFAFATDFPYQLKGIISPQGMCWVRVSSPRCGGCSVYRGIRTRRDKRRRCSN